MTNKILRFNPLEYPSLFQEPWRLTDVTSWHEHIPFAFVLIEMLRPKVFVELGTHRGDSYFAFCQAVSVLKLDTKCYAVDTWKGEEHAGFYGEEIYEELKAYNEAQYRAFSTLVRSTFDGALAKFPDRSVDLLHVDGLHTYEAVRHDFETWLPKMSERGVILFHDISVHERGFGVWRLWDELKEKYPSLEFKHGNGLGLIAAGGRLPQAPADFFFADVQVARRISAFFSLLGSRISLRSQLAEKDRYIEALLNSYSWRITAPLRRVLRFLRRDQKV